MSRQKFPANVSSQLLIYQDFLAINDVQTLSNIINAYSLQVVDDIILQFLVSNGFYAYIY